MARRRSKESEEGLPLFDLPLQAETDPEGDRPFDEEPAIEEPVIEEPAIDRLGAEEGSAAATLLEEEPPVENLPQEQDEEAEEPRAEVIPIQTSLFQSEEEDEEEEDAALAEELASWSDRLLSGISDLAVHAAMLGIAVGGSYGLGVQVDTSSWPPFAVLTLIFSFLYWTIPLAFWGQTPGMAWIGTISRSLDDEPLAFGQAVLRWVGALVTLALVGIPMLLSFSGKSFSDWLSDSKTELV